MPSNAPPASAGSPVTGAIRTAASAWFARRDAGFSPSEAHDFERWLAADPRHAVAFAELDSAWTTFGKPARAGVADDLVAELARRAAHRRRRRLGAAAAGVALLLALGVFWRTPPRADTAENLPATAVMLTPARRVLPDGSVVLLKDGARITTSFTAGERRIGLVQGEAMFEVAKDRARPFIVAAGGVEVRAVGTAFSVDLRRSSVEVLITEGTVAVDHVGSPSSAPVPTAAAASPAAPPPPAALVEAGHRVVVAIAPSAPAPTVTPMAAAEIGERLAWRHRRVEFSGTSLAEAVAVLNREGAGPSAARLVIDETSLRSMRVSGIFQTDNTEAFVLLLEAGFGVTTERVGSEIRLRRAPVAPGRR